MSDYGSVARGICSVDPDGYLQGIKECVGIDKTEAGAQLQQADGSLVAFSGKETASMNFWGFLPDLFPPLERLFEEFLQEREFDAKAEFYLPVAIGALIDTRECSVKLLQSDDPWFGLTYPGDRDFVMRSLAEIR